MSNLILTCCFIGHGDWFRVSGKSIDNLREILEMLINQNVKRFLVGTHGEFDRVALAMCRELRKKYNDIEIIVVKTNLAFLNNKDLADNYRDIKTLVYDIENVYFKECINYSNKKMIDDSDIVVACVDNDLYKSNSKKFLSYAIKKKKKIFNVFKK